MTMTSHHHHLLLALGLLLSALSSCSRPHLTETYGRSYTAAFAAQAPPPDKPKRATTGLDSQEASIVSESYRRSLAPKSTEVTEQPVILLGPPATGGPAPALAPSVPQWK